MEAYLAGIEQTLYLFFSVLRPFVSILYTSSFWALYRARSPSSVFSKTQCGFQHFVTIVFEKLHWTWITEARSEYVTDISLPPFLWASFVKYMMNSSCGFLNNIEKAHFSFKISNRLYCGPCDEKERFLWYSINVRRALHDCLHTCQRQAGSIVRNRLGHDDFLLHFPHQSKWVRRCILRLQTHTLLCQVCFVIPQRKKNKFQTFFWPICNIIEIWLNNNRDQRIDGRSKY